ncbi:MAG TPA: peptide chain release factor N(5)-glutamine methyltransferase [Vicinamibacterales bacterium]|nr:peptide chain release factor N(5)-glutamine methyltransferase [Vicinamibacterales bacterium]
MATLQEHLGRARETLTSAGIAPGEAALDVDVLARHVLGWDRARLLSSLRDGAPRGFESSYSRLIARRACREPVAQITGIREFWGLDFEVTRDVLTPRPETELIVEEALAQFPGPGASVRSLAIADVGTGSGCLAVALAREFPRSKVVATDISSAALAVASRNAVRHAVNDRIALVETSYLPSTRPLDLIVSNPPYIANRDAASLPPEVRDYEPHEALFAGPDGFQVYRGLLDLASGVADGGRMILELGYDQLEPVTTSATAHGWTVVSVRHDLQGIPRVLALAPTGRS